MSRGSTRRYLPSLVSLLLLLTAACGPEPQQVPTTTTRDSAGVRIVENEAPLLAEDECWTVGPEASVTIGEVDGPPEYILVSPWAARLSDGRIAVLDRGDKELRLYSADGRYLSASGREGEGPGEFRGSSSVHVVAGDTMVVWDMSLRRLSLFDSAGAFVRSVTLQESEPIQLSLGVLDRHTLLGSRLIEPMDSAGLYVGRREVLVLSSDGQAKVVVDTIHEPRHSGDRMMTFLPFGPMPFFVAGAGRAFLTHGAPFEILVFQGDGSLSQVIRRAWTGEPVTEEDQQEYLDWMLSHGNRERRERFLPTWEEAARLSSHKPAISWISPDRSGNIWVAGFAGYGPDRLKQYDVFDPAGTWVCTVQMPQELLMITDIGEDYVLGLVLDDLEVQKINMYPLRR